MEKQVREIKFSIWKFTRERTKNEFISGQELKIYELNTNKRKAFCDCSCFHLASAGLISVDDRG